MSVSDIDGGSPGEARIYLRPALLARGRDAAAAIAAGLALPLAGGPVAFAALEIAERDGHRVRRRMLAHALAPAPTGAAAARYSSACPGRGADPRAPPAPAAGGRPRPPAR